MRALIALLPLFTAACDRQAAPAPQANQAAAAEPEVAGKLDISQRGSPAPSVAFTAPDGGRATLGQFRGKPLLVNLWATYCGPCVKEMPSLDRLAARTGGKLAVLTVSQDPEGAKLVAPWWAKRDLRHLQPWLDEKTELGFAFGSGMLPTTVLYDAEGKEIWRIVGTMDWDGPRANTLLADVVG